jgi:CBS domain-containing protein
MKIAELMVRDVQTCRTDDDMSVPAKIMWDADCGCVPVVDEDLRIVGMITDRDVCMAAYTQGRALCDMRVGSAMSQGVHVCGTEDDVTVAESLMKRERLHRLPVTDARRRLVGILSLNDIALASADRRKKAQKGLAPDDVASVLAAVCTHRDTTHEAVLIPVHSERPEHALST